MLIGKLKIVKMLLISLSNGLVLSEIYFIEKTRRTKQINTELEILRYLPYLFPSQNTHTYKFNQKLTSLKEPKLKYKTVAINPIAHKSNTNIHIIMLKPKNHIFRLKFNLTKVEAMNNKVNSKVHAYLHIDNEKLQFKGAPQLKKNIALFNSDLQYENYAINYDEVTGLYENKNVLLIVEFQTQGAFVKVGEVSVNLGSILNDKKYRVVNIYPLSKCYDKSAKVKLSVDFIPTSEKKDNRHNPQNIHSHHHHQTTDNKSLLSRSNAQNSQQSPPQQDITLNDHKIIYRSSVAGNNKNPTHIIKSRLAEEQNVILQEKVYEYERKLDNYRLTQNQLSQRMQEQSQRKDQKISDLTLEMNKLQNTLHLISMENESFKNQLRVTSDELNAARNEIKRHLATIDSLQKTLNERERTIESKNTSLENLQKTKEHKEKHLLSEIAKYTAKYSQSEQERNTIIFQLENKLKQELERKDKHYQSLLKENQEKYFGSLKEMKDTLEQTKMLHHNLEDSSSQQDTTIKGLKIEKQNQSKRISSQEEEMLYLNKQLQRYKKSSESLSNEVQSVSFSYQNTLQQLSSTKDQLKQLKKSYESIRVQLSMSNQTCEDQRQRINILNKELQIHEERQFYMKEQYQGELHNRNQNEEHILLEKDDLFVEYRKTKEMLKIEEGKLQDEREQLSDAKRTIQTLQSEVSHKNSTLMALSQEKIYTETQVKRLRAQRQDKEGQIEDLRKQVRYLKQTILQKESSLENQRSVEWSYKIETLQNDIQIMVEKFKKEKQQQKQSYERQLNQKSNQIAKLESSLSSIKANLESTQTKLTKTENILQNNQKQFRLEVERTNQLQRDYIDTHEKYKVQENQCLLKEEQLESLSVKLNSKVKEIQEISSKQQKLSRKNEQIRHHFNQIISRLLQNMTKRHSERVSFQELSSFMMTGSGSGGETSHLNNHIEAQFINYVNLALKRFCEDHNKTREYIKDLETFRQEAEKAKIGRGNNSVRDQYRSESENRQSNQFGQKPSPQPYEQYGYENAFNGVENYFYGGNGLTTGKNPYENLQRSYSPYSNKGPITHQFDSSSTMRQVESYRYEIDRLKRIQSESKVKIKSLEDEVEKHQRQLDNEKFQQARLKQEIEDQQDQNNRINFTLRKKDKIIQELQGELKDLQKVIFDLKANASYVYEKAKDKIGIHENNGESLSNSRYRGYSPNNHSKRNQQNGQQLEDLQSSLKQLQGKLILKDEEIDHLTKELESLREKYLGELNEVKNMQAKIKEKNNKLSNLQKQHESALKAKTERAEKQQTKLHKRISNLNQEIEQKNKDVLSRQQIIKDLQSDISSLEHRNKELHEQIAYEEVKMKQSIKSNEFKISDAAVQYETEILQYKSELSQCKDKVEELKNRNVRLETVEKKRNAEIQELRQKLNLKENQCCVLEETLRQLKSASTLKDNERLDKIRHLEAALESKSFELEECRFAYEGRVLQLERQIDDFRQNLTFGQGANK